MVVVREWSSRKGWMYTVEGPWFFNTHESHIVVGKPKKPAGLRKKSIDSAKEIQTDTAPALPHLSGPERWAFNIGPDDVVLRTKLYSLLGPVPARAMLAKAFPSGTAQPEIDEFFKLADSSDGSIVRKGAAIAKAINLAFARNDLEPPAAL
jgi:hypothetical protein